MTDSWARFTAARKVAMVEEIYASSTKTTTGIAMALNERFGLGLSRNAVAGLYSRVESLRQRFPLLGQGNFNNKPSSAKSPVLAQIKEQALDLTELDDDPLAPAEPIIVSKTVLDQKIKHRALEKDVLLTELGPRMCKWATNEGGPFRFCGCSTPSPTEQYCDFHSKLAYTAR